MSESDNTNSENHDLDSDKNQKTVTTEYFIDYNNDINVNNFHSIFQIL